MRLILSGQARITILALGCFQCLGPSLAAGVSKDIQNTYVQAYENRAMFLKVPIHGARQLIFVNANGPSLDTSSMGQTALFNVGDQVRITNVDFRNAFVRFRLTSVDGTKVSELHFLFPGELTNLFPQKPNFDQALSYALTEGESYRDIEAARESFVDNQFDRLLSQFAATAGISRTQLVDRITEQSPDFQKAKSDLTARTQEVREQRELLAQEKAKSESLARANAGVQEDIRKAEAAADSLKQERLDLLNERDQLKQGLSKLEAEQANWQRSASQYEQQVDALIGNLNLQEKSSDDFGGKVESLSQVIDKLKLEGGQISEKLSESGRRVAQLLQENKDQQEEIRKLATQKARLDSNLKVLTTGKNNINQTLLDVQQERDNLAAARDLQSAIRWSRQPGSGDRSLAFISIHEHKIAEFEIEEPVTVNRPFFLQLRLDSPDLVKFDPQERALYEQLGEKISVETSWKTAPGIEASLVSGDALQEVEPRGQAGWNWSFSGKLESPEPAVLLVRLKDVNGLQVQLAEREFVLRSGGLWATLGGSFSLWSLLIGLTAGLTAALVAHRFTAVKKKTPHPVEYMAKKRL